MNDGAKERRSEGAKERSDQTPRPGGVRSLPTCQLAGNRITAEKCHEYRRVKTATCLYCDGLQVSAWIPPEERARVPEPLTDHNPGQCEACGKRTQVKKTYGDLLCIKCQRVVAYERRKVRGA